MFGSVASPPRSSASSKSFVRAAPRRARLRHWLAGVPLIAVAAFTFNAAAPAEMSSDMLEPSAAQEQARWSLGNAKNLLAAVEESAAEGLNPADYDVTALRTAVARGSAGAELDGIATRSALGLAHDYAGGRVDDKKSLDWHFGPEVDNSRLEMGLADALAQGRVDSWLRGLLPDGQQYRALKTAYAITPAADRATRDQLRANLERWRWMPRTLGDRYIYVNVPAYRLELVENGIEQAGYNVIVGAPKTPTPQLLLHARSVVANPSWTVPQSIVRSGGVHGNDFRWTRLPDGSFRVQQLPGPNNALGRVKIDMPNPMAIYLHDTPNRRALARENRALSHGCVRVAEIEELAAELRGSGADLDEALADPSTTRVLPLEKSIPVYIVYFTAQADDQGAVTLLDDPYGRDEVLLDRLGRSSPGHMIVAAR